MQAGRSTQLINNNHRATTTSGIGKCARNDDRHANQFHQTREDVDGDEEEDYEQEEDEEASVEEQLH